MKRAMLRHGPRLPISALRTALIVAGAVACSLNAPAASAGPPCGNGHGYAWTRAAGWLPSRAANLDATPGLRIALDPVTRRPVTPTPEQRAAGSLAAPQMDEMLPAERILGGGELIHLNGRHQVFEVVRRDASGRFRTTCADDSASAARLVTTPIPAPTREAK